MDKNLVIDGLIKELRAKKADARKLRDAGKTEECQEVIKDIKKTESTLHDMMDILDHAGPEEKANSFINILKASIGIKKISDTDRAIMNYMQEGTGADGGFTVPTDIITDVKTLRNDGADLESLVTVEPVTTEEGRRTIEVRADETPLEEVDEEGTIPDVAADKLTEVKYKVTKRAGIITVTNELLSDSNNVVLRWLKKWLAKKTKATRNAAIIKKINEMTAGKEVVITAAKGLKSIFNKTLDTYSNSSVVLTNGSGYDYLDNMVDEAGRPVLESDTANKRKLLFGLHPVTKVSDKTMPSKVVLNVDGETVDAYQHPIVCGDLKEAITLFDREKLTIELNSKSGSVFFNDLTKIKVRDRIDVQAVDKDAIIKAYVQVEA